MTTPQIPRHSAEPTGRPDIRATPQIPAQWGPPTAPPQWNHPQTGPQWGHPQTGPYWNHPQIPPQWAGPPSARGPRPDLPKRGIGLGLAALITAAIGLLFGLFGSAIGFLLGLVAIGLGIAGYIRRSGRVLAAVGGGVAALAMIASLTVASVGASTSSTPASASPTPSAPPVSTAPVAQPTTAPPPPPAPARTITARDWQKIAKDPTAHIGESIVVYGTVTQFDAATGTDSFRANVDGVRQQNEYEYETNTFLTGDVSTLSDVVNGDTFRAEVVVGQPYTYTTTMGGQMTVPTLSVTKIAPLK
ncbi:proline-rich domain-containing protein [Pseudonocardia endophytica]|uniref:DUF4190 domain-containing protein n=1 Tax=Pseudonocardia endophytica TaxID=401976 RepID=A0A4R1I9G1_PSEEN|nr:proline-rich domain-containing protein [Pseudonocardia endophytica]TCK26882.1 hypothetical protein EV378_2727 [Pseudonocardia endophytica]